MQKVDGSLANISSDVGEVHRLLGTMADDASAQSLAISEITTAIGAMDQSTQQNAAMVRAVQFYQLKRNLARASKPARAAAYLSCRTELA